MNKLLLTALTFTLMATAACQKTRDAAFASNEEQSLYSVSQYNGTMFDIQTGEIIMTAQAPENASEKEEQVKIDLEDGAFTQVSYKVSSAIAEKLLNGVSIFGRPNFKYQGVIRLTEKTVTVYKISKPEDVPASEATYAEKQGDGTLLIPLVELPVDGVVNVERKKNEMGEVTSTKVLKDEKSLTQAEFFKMDITKAKKFTAVSKADLLPATYFAGEWYLAETVSLPETAEQADDSFKQIKAELKRVKFAIGGDTMRAVDAKMDMTSQDKSEWNLATTMIFDIERKAFKVDAFVEKEDTEMKLRARPFVKVEFATARTINSPATIKLVGVDVTKDQFSFVLEDKSDITRPRIRYSFLRVKKEAPVLAVRGGEQVEKQEQVEKTEATQENTEAVQATPDASSPALTSTPAQ